MNRLLTIAFALLFALPSCGQQEIRLIVRGDDMGFSHAANHAILETWKEGIMTSVEIMVPVPWFPEAAKLCNENPSMDVGIHLTMTSEWENMKWRPLTGPSSLTDDDGYFYPMVWPNDNYGEDKALKTSGWKIEDVEKELRAQIELAKKHIPHISHISAHMGFTSLDEKVAEMTEELAKEYGLHIDLEAIGVKRARYMGEKATPEQKIESFIAMLNSLEAGNIYLFVDHPAYDVAEVQGIHHVGYDKVAKDREGVTQCWTSEAVKKVIEERRIKLVSYKDLVGIGN